MLSSDWDVQVRRKHLLGCLPLDLPFEINACDVELLKSFLVILKRFGPFGSSSRHLGFFWSFLWSSVRELES